MPDQDWLETLKTGDEVVVNGLEIKPALDVVYETALDLIMTKNHGGFRRKSGRSTRLGYVWLVCPDARIKAELAKAEVKNGH